MDKNRKYEYIHLSANRYPERMSDGGYSTIDREEGVMIWNTKVSPEEIMFTIDGARDIALERGLVDPNTYVRLPLNEHQYLIEPKIKVADAFKEKGLE